MTDIFQYTTRPDKNLFFQKADENDVRLGEIVSSETKDYTDSEIVILGCPQDEGVRRNKGRTGAALAPDLIRPQFYKLTNFGITAKLFDLGNTIIKETLEEIHEIHTQIVRQILNDGKKLIVLGGGNDISYADGRAMSLAFGFKQWAAINIDAHFDARADFPPNSGTPYRQLLEEKLLKPENFCEFGWQKQINSPVYFNYLGEKGVTLISLEKIRETTNQNNLSFHTFLKTSLGFSNRENDKKNFFGFDVDSVRASDAPGVSAASPVGLSAEEFIALAQFAGENPQTKIIEFTETNPNFDIDNRTTKLVAVAMHKFCNANAQKNK